MYDAIRAATDAYYYTAVALDVANTILSTAQLLEGLYDTGRIILGKLQQAESIRDAAGNVIGALKNGDQIELRTGGRKRTCRLAADGTLYDLRGNYVGVLDDDLQFSVRSLPEAIHANNRLRFTIEDGRLYRITQTTDGAAIRTCKGTVDGGGIVRNLHGQIVEKIDLNTGQTLESYRALTESLQKAGARNVTVNTFGELVYADSGKALRKKRIHGVTTYVDDAGNPLLTEYMGTGDTVYLKSAGTGRTVGALADGVFDGAWENTLNLQRSRATQAARDAIARFVQDKPNRTVRKYFPQLGTGQVEFIRSTGRLPTDFEIHHVRNVANYPDLAADYANLELLSHDAHRAAHGGDYKNPTSTPTKTYVNLAQVLAGYW